MDMRRIYAMCLFGLAVLLSAVPMEAQVVENTTPVAFPGAEGHGRFVTGGRGGRVIYVTNLNNSGVGSFRDAVETQSGTRTVVFAVSGIIELQSNIRIRNGNLTIAGQTAPGDGITLKNYTVQVDASNLIIRFLRFRMGDEKATENDAIWGRRQQNIILDHCTISWATDEASSFYDNSNFTMQWCLLSESLRNSVHDKGRHGYMGIWGGKKASFHHNLLVHHDSRVPRFCGSRYSNLPDEELVDFRNNVLFNWGGNNGYAGEGGSYNMVNNYYKPGPASKNRGRIFQPYPDNGGNEQPAGVWGTFYVNGNYNTEYASVNNDNWAGIHPAESKPKAELRSDVAFDKGQITTHSAQDAYEVVLSYAGASLVRDAVDARVVNEARQDTYTFTVSNGGTNGHSDSQADVGGWPVHSSSAAPLDSDGDGMPDAWELAYGLNPNDPSDGNGYDHSSMFTNVEVYLNSLVAPITKAKLAQGVANYVDDYGYSDEVIAANPEVASMEEVSLFPNPATDHFKVVSRSTAIAAVRIYTPSGTLVQQSPVYANEQVVPVSGLNKGLYLVEVRLIDGSKQVVKLQL